MEDSISRKLRLAHEKYVKGFLEGCQGKLAQKEIDLLPMGAKTMTYECGMRFLADYIEGDVYFATKYPDHNLVRARTQIKLATEMEESFDKTSKIIDEIFSGFNK